MIGETIGNFRLISRLGRGGMGEVYQAEHTSLQTPAAVKVLNEDISENHDHVQRFFNEARIVSKIKHAGRVQIFDSGYHQGRAYLVMELLDGESLAARIERVGPLPIAELLDLGQQIASVLDATHRAGVTHRDLKPDNIFVIKDDERASGERVKILDFGIAKLTGSTLASNSPKTAGTMGTPQYMAPEQWGDSSRVDWRADAYSLGCVLYELATGAPPFECSSIAEAYAKHLNEKPASLIKRRAEIPEPLDELVARLLAKQPAARGRSMAEICSAFAAIGQHATSPTIVRPATLTTLGGSAAELHEPPRRRTALYGGLFAGALVLGTVIFISTRHAPPPDPVPAADPGPAAVPVAVPAAVPVAVPVADAAAAPDAAAAAVPDAAPNRPDLVTHPIDRPRHHLPAPVITRPPPQPPRPSPDAGIDMGGRI